MNRKYTGQAPLGEYVKIRKETPKEGFSLVPFSVTKGEFTMELSTHFLASRPAHQTAGTIAHELLHSLGHDHKNGYYDNNFITAFGDTLGNDGKYFRRQKSAGLSLHGEDWPLPK